MKRVLIITYYWPPSGGSGVQRWLKMSKYLPEYGWQPVVYTAEGAEYPVEDPSLEKDVSPEAEVIRHPITEPYSFYKKFLGMKKEQKVKAGFIDDTGHKQGWKENLSIWIRGNFFIPDARCWWVKPSVKYLKSYLKEHPVDAIISTGPPHSMHLIAMKLKETLDIPWIADFRDPWTEIDYYSKLRLSRWADRKHHRLEREVLTKADKVVTVSPNWAKRFEALGAPKAEVVYNGFDESDIDQTGASFVSDKFTLTYLGVLFKVRNPECLWQALGELITEDTHFASKVQVKLIGQVDKEVMQALSQNGLKNHVVLSPYIPHDQVATVLHQSTVLLLPLMPDTETDTLGLIPAKLFEYMASGRPILCIGPQEGDTAKILDETHAGVTVGFDDKKKAKEAIRLLFQQHLSDGLANNETQEIGRFSRKNLCGEIAILLDNLKQLP